MTLYEIALNAIENGNRFKINLNSKSLVINKKVIIDQGDIVSGDFYNTELINNYDDPWNVIENLYHDYKYSLPSENHLGNKSYFKAVDDYNLTLNQMIHSLTRDYAQAKLELFILLSSLSGNLKWKDNSKWFYQGKDKSLVILKQWVTN